VHTRPIGRSTLHSMRAVLRTMRYWGPVVVACACLIAAYSVPPVVTYVLVIVAFVLLFEVGTALFERAGGTGGLKDFRQ
jgi:Sec-independent protein secretion pathway component TatC